MIRNCSTCRYARRNVHFADWRVCVFRAFSGMTVLRFWLICHVLGGTLRILRINMHYEVVWSDGDLWDLPHLCCSPGAGAGLVGARVCLQD